MSEETSPPLSVLHIFKIFYPDVFGGIPSVIRDICAALKGSFASSVLVCSNSGGERCITVDDVPVERVRSLGNLLSLPVAPTYPLWLWHRIAKHDLVALHAPFPLADVVFALGLGRNRPLVVHWHADIVTQASLRRYVEPLMRWTLRRADAVVVSNAVLASGTPLLREFSEKCHVVPFGIDVSKYDTLVPPARPKPERGGLVLACGRLVPYKGFDVLVRAAAGRGFNVWITGEGRERAHLEQLIRQLDVGDRVHLLGSVPDDELAKLMCTADVFVMPSVTSAETFGLVQLEAMAAGRPIVNTSLDTAVPYVARDGIEAITVPPGDHTKLADAIDEVLSDPDLRQRMGHAARQRVITTYSAAVFGEAMDKIYRHAIAEHAASAPSRAARPTTSGLSSIIQIAAALAWSDVRHRYVRSLLGPFWMSLQMAIMVVVLGSVLGHLSNGSTTSYLPILAVSLTAWNFLNGVVIDSMTALQNSTGLIKDRALPPVIFLLQCFFRQALFALHNACVPLILWLIFSPINFTGAMAALPGFLLFIVATLGLGLVLGAMATRFHDLKPIIESTLMLAFLASPVIWSASMIDRTSTVIRLNPVTHLFAVWREPLTGGHVATLSLVYVLVGVAVLALASVVTIVQLRKAAFWI